MTGALHAHPAARFVYAHYRDFLLYGLLIGAAARRTA